MIIEIITLIIGTTISIILPILIFFISSFILFHLASKILEKKLMKEEEPNNSLILIGLISIIGLILNFVFSTNTIFSGLLPYPESFISLLLISFFIYFLTIRYFKFDKKEAISYSTITSILINYLSLDIIWGAYDFIFFKILINYGIITETYFIDNPLGGIFSDFARASFILLSAIIAIILFRKTIKKETENWKSDKQKNITNITHKINVILFAASILAAIIIIIL